MKKLFMIFTVFICLFSSSIFIQAQNNDQVSGSDPIVVPENIRSLVEQITNAENNENWEEYATLREEIIQAWQKVNPEVAKLYSNSNSGKPDLTADGMPISSDRLFNNILLEDDYEIPMESPDWGEDVMITNGKAYDISMDVNRNGDIFVAVDGRKDGTAIKDTVYVYKSTDGGLTWSEWSFISASTRTFNQVELICFDHPSGTEEYILLFFRFDNGWVRVGRSDMSTPGWTYHTIVSEGVLDFAVDRNYSSTNYRAICIYDSSNIIYSTRSEPTSYGTIWQDKHSLGLLGRDLDFAYGWNGAVYTTFNGNNSGNLYVIENTNYADPTSWGSTYTVTQGSVDTTRHAEIIASREDDPNNKVIVVFEKRAGSTYDLYDATRDNNVWTAYNSWVLPDENKWPSMSIEYSATQNFRAAFEQSGLGNTTPRRIKYKTYDGSIWSGSLQFSDPSNDVTGLQKPEVGDIDGSTPVSAFVGANYIGVFFDNESWAPPTAIISLNPTSLNFGGVEIGSSSMETFTIFNIGNADLIVTNITSSEPVFTVNLTNTTITPGNSQDVEVTFTPTLVQPYNGIIVITHNAPGSPSNLNVVGEGVQFNVTVTSPNGGEIWEEGSTHDITWTSVGVADVMIELSINNGASWSTEIASTPSSGTYSWIVPSTTSDLTQCLIRISDVTNSATNDVSDNVFTIEKVVSVEDDFSSIPDDYAIFQNYPNPFNPVTTIYFAIPEISFVEIKVYDALGSEVATILADTKEAGYHHVQFDATNLQSGIYFYQLQAGNFIETKKMILMK